VPLSQNRKINQAYSIRQERKACFSRKCNVIDPTMRMKSRNSKRKTAVTPLSA
jgi:hypothetical protein